MDVEALDLPRPDVPSDHAEDAFGVLGDEICRMPTPFVRAPDPLLAEKAPPRGDARLQDHLGDRLRVGVGRLSNRPARRVHVDSSRSLLLGNTRTRPDGDEATGQVGTPFVNVVLGEGVLEAFRQGGVQAQQ